MRTLLATLLDHDPGLVEIIARRWDVDIAGLDKHDAAEKLTYTMLDTERAAHEWERLNETERGVLQTLLGSAGHKMTEAQFSRLFGEIRQMGPGRREREKPHLSPASTAEALYYRGLIATAFDQAKTGVQNFIYVPSDLAEVLPTHKTGFDLSAPEMIPEENSQPDQTRAATTTLVDDLTTLLAYLQIASVSTEKDEVRQQVSEALEQFWLGEANPARLALMISLVSGLGLVTNEGGHFKVVPTNARPWLEQSRPRQVRALAEVWRDTTLFNDLWHTPGIEPEDTGWRNDPLLPRQTILSFLEVVPDDDWWPLDELIEMVKTEEPDFQRPAGDYESWYIRDPKSGQYLQGFESWDQVDGAVLRFVLTGPMHWLGLVDLGDNGTLCRLTVYGRAFGGEGEWPDPAEEREHLGIQADGTLLAPRNMSRYERFQVARISEWVSAGDPFGYRLSAGGLRRASQQGIQVDAIQAFLRRTSGVTTFPVSVVQLLEQWQKAGHADVWMTRAVVLQASTPEAMRVILETPDLRRYLGVTLGPAAVMVRPGQENELADALRQHGILAEFES
ncbi:MAG TPA: helicase-associated domain-containing protein [Aggregatilineaceae bacterium]|nr:helicase-associated domain-containing protein [Aggregatilineaceae bacterium]